VVPSPPTGHRSASASSSTISAEPTSLTLAQELAVAVPEVVVPDLAEDVDLAVAVEVPAGDASPSKTTKPRKKKGKGRTGRKLFQHDRALGVRFVAGADEAGRGSLAGPLVAAAVLFDYDRLGPRDVRALSLLNDSKQHTEAAREALYPVVLRIATRVAVVSRSAGGIDRRGLHKTNLAALRESLLKVAGGRDEVICLSDGFPVGDLEGHTGRAIVEGDATSAAIAAASIIAKVTRDRFMRRADARHPGWEFATHVGYSTPEHRDAIQRHGVSPLHRMSFQSTAYQQLAL
jgi:ribonuclease HII